jgi:metal-responsive CopG/Arc/MetJ family transcriptional regulator
MAKIAVSLPADLLVRVDAAAAAAGQSRSAFLRHSLESVLSQLEEERAVLEVGALYAEIESDPVERRLAEAYASLAIETVPPFESEPADTEDSGAATGDGAR